MSGNRMREAALASPIDLKEAGSPEWAWQKIYALKRRWEQVEDDHKQVEQITSELQRYRVWEKIPPDRPYGSWDVLLKHELGIAEREFDSKIAEVKARAETAEPLAKNGEIGGGHSSPNIIRPGIHGTSATYLTRRIARDHPGILDRMKAGEYKSVRAAALEAGIVKPQITVPLDPESVARALKRHFSKEQLAEIVRLVTT